MARYIDAYKLEKDLPQSVPKHNVIINGNEYPVFLVDHILHKVRNFPTADVVKVVRCEKCKDFEPHGNGKGGICRNKKLKPCLRYSTDYCSYGERGDR